MDELLKQRLMIALVAFNLTVVTYMIVMSFTGAGVIDSAVFWGRFIVAVGIGAVVAAVAFVAVMFSQK